MEDVLKIMELIPHRYPFLMVDRILSVEKEKIIGIKNVTINEPFFQGHFPDHPIMPGVLIVEGMAQCAGVLMLRLFDDPQSKVVYFASIDKVKFRKPVVPGDQIKYQIDISRFGGKICKFKGTSYVDDQIVCEAEMVASIMDRDAQAE